MKAQSKPRKNRQAYAHSVNAQKPKILGWNTTDADEIALRRWRGDIEPMSVQALETAHPIFGAFCVQSSSRQSYHVEIRHLSAVLNSCDCPDYQHNGLGTCKHIEKTLGYLRQNYRRQWPELEKSGSERVEIFLDQRDQKKIISILWPKSLHRRAAVRRELENFFSSDQRLLEHPLQSWPKIREILTGVKPAHQKIIRVSAVIDPFFQQLRRQEQIQQYKNNFLQDVQKGKRSLEILKLSLYPYQQEGMLHLALKERALLGDEMGLGKTIQAIAACELLRRTQNIKTVLVVATASLKTEWEEQILKCTDLPYLIINGERAQRLKQYRQPSFFYLTNYEQMMSDSADVQHWVKPDVIILDEAQRIKNWQTKTAHAIKRLHSRYAFVLTGTPLENRIDDIYSIIQFLDPNLFGPLFRFNRDFYELNDKGKPVAYKNLDQLHQRLQPLLLRRRKQDVEDELPPATTQEFFVGMTEEQQARYEEQQKYVSRLVKLAERRPLTPEEDKKLRIHLASMRMLCDTPYILDADCRDCPKLIELEHILEEILEDTQTKVIIFSEWERMLQLVRELTQKMGIGAAWHTGSVPQKKRRQEINRFKQDAHCRLFLSTDSGSVGLNLQVANVVINLDLPWNPAKLAQRVARAWRKHQERSVQVINLITEHSIEHRMVHLLSEKQNLAQGVLHGDNDLRSMKLPSGRMALLERVAQLLQLTTAAVKPVQELTAILPKGVDYLAVCETSANQSAVLAVMERPSPQIHEQIQSVLQAQWNGKSAALEILDRQTFAAIQRLAQAGLLTLHPQLRSLHGHPDAVIATPTIPARWLETARQGLKLAERPWRLAEHLFNGHFYSEALPPWREAFEMVLTAVAWRQGLGEEIVEERLSIEQIQQLIHQQQVSASALTLTHFLRENASWTAEQMQSAWQDSQALMRSIRDSFI